MNAPAALKSAAEILRNYNISTESSAVGRYYAICPRCSHKRKKVNQKLKCLGVTIDDKGVGTSVGTVHVASAQDGGVTLDFHPGEDPRLRPAGGVEVACHLY